MSRNALPPTVRRGLLALLAGAVATGALAVGGLALPAAADPPAPGAAAATYPAGSVVSVRGTVAGAQAQLARRLVGGLTREAAAQLVRGDVDAVLRRAVTVTVRPPGAKVSSLRVSARSLLAAPAGIALPAPVGGAAPLREVVRVGENAGGLRTFLGRASTAARVLTVDARVSLGSGSTPLAFDRGHAGAVLDRAKAGGVLLAALRTGTTRPLAVLSVPQRFGAGTLDTVLVVHTRANTLDVFTRGRRARTIRVATGQAGYPSPHGSFHVVQKQPAPSWYNPHSSWSAGYPDVIGPGPDNPLGTRALALDAAGILIHGVPGSEDATLGSNASHGCIRVQRATIEALYPTVPVGTPVIITN